MLFPSNSVSNAVAGIRGRMLNCYDKVTGGWLPIPKPQTGYVLSVLKQYSEGLRQLSYPLTKMSESQYLATCHGARRKRYEKASETNRSKGQNKREKVTTFVKLEGHRLKVGSPLIPRMIVDPGPAYNLALGCYIKPIEAVIFPMITQLFGNVAPVVLKGFNCAKQGSIMHQKWTQFHDPVFIGGDAKKFDAHTSRAALEFEFGIYRNFFPADPHFVWLLEHQYGAKIQARFPDGHLSYELNGGRWSGVQNTGLGNSVITTAIVYAWVLEKGLRVEMVDNGDDWGVMLDRKDVPLFLDGFVDFCFSVGYRMVLEAPVYLLEHIEFCQTKPVWTPDGYIMVRDHHVSRLKDSVTSKNFSEKDFRSWAAAVGAGGMSMCGGVPVMQEYYSFMLRCSKGAIPSLTAFDVNAGRYQLSKGMSRKHHTVHPDTRYSYWLAFGVLPDSQLEQEAFYRSVSHADWVKDPAVVCKKNREYLPGAPPASLMMDLG